MFSKLAFFALTPVLVNFALAQNLVANPSFEVGAPGSPVVPDWVNTDLTTSFIAFGVANTGLQSFAVGAPSTLPGFLQQIVGDTVPGTCYSVSAAFRTDAVGDSSEISSALTFGSLAIAVPISSQPIDTWTTYTFYAVADLAGVITIQSYNDVGITYIDDVVVEEAVDPVLCLSPSITRRRRERRLATQRRRAVQAQW